MGTFQLKESTHPKVEGPLVVVIMDGVGVSPRHEGNALVQAQTPTLKRLEEQHYATILQAHGHAVGMPSNKDMGNSEVGHNTLGAGRVFDQGAKLVEEAIKSGEISQAPVWKEMLGHCRQHGTPLHFIGLLSDGNVHSHIEHLFYLLKKANKENIEEVYIHILLDGRDVAPQSAHEFIQNTEDVLAQINKQANRRYKIASGGGRMKITMDRYGADWKMLEDGWKTHVCGEGQHFSSALDALSHFRQQEPNICDQDIPAFIISENEKAIGPIRDGAAVIGFNFRGDRMLELCQAFEAEHFEPFKRTNPPQVLFAGMTLYDGDTHTPGKYLVSPPEIESTFGELLAERGRRQFACSETQKYGHVTYFWNGNRSAKFSPKLESYQEIPSLKSPFDEHPEMRAAQITEHILRESQKQPFDFARINYANGDMVGHTGNFEATIKAVEALDQNLHMLVENILAQQGALIITADHGNAEEMYHFDGPEFTPRKNALGQIVPKTSHSLNPVPCFICLPPKLRSTFKLKHLEHRGLANIASTAAMLMGYMPPEIYEPSLLEYISP